MSVFSLGCPGADSNNVFVVSVSSNSSSAHTKRAPPRLPRPTACPRDAADRDSAEQATLAEV